MAIVVFKSIETKVTFFVVFKAIEIKVTFLMYNLTTYDNDRNGV